nr:glycosyltransferase [Prochlorococcus marinus]
MELIYDPFTFLKAAKELLNKNSNYMFLLANEGSLKPSIEQYILNNNLQDSVKLIGRQLGTQNINFYNSLDIYVSTSLRDGGLSASVAEAMSCERLVIVSDNSENSNYIVHGKSGYLFSNKDFYELSRLIELSTSDISLSRDIGKNARSIIKKDCNFHIEMDKVNKVYDSI